MYDKPDAFMRDYENELFLKNLAECETKGNKNLNDPSIEKIVDNNNESVEQNVAANSDKVDASLDNSTAGNSTVGNEVKNFIPEGTRY